MDQVARGSLLGQRRSTWGSSHLGYKGLWRNSFLPRQQKAPSIWVSEIFRKAALDPSPGFLYQLELPRNF